MSNAGKHRDEVRENLRDLSAGGKGTPPGFAELKTKRRNTGADGIAHECGGRTQI